MYRRGIVEEVKGASVRVRFPQQDDLVSGWLDVLQGATHGDRDYRMPTVGTQVAVMLDEHDESGCVLGALYSEADQPPAASVTQRVVELADGFRVEYDQASHVLRVTVPAGGRIELAGNASAVALATAVASELNALRSDYAAHTHIAGTLVSAPPGAPVTGVTGAPVAVTYSVGDVAAAQLHSA